MTRVLRWLSAHGFGRAGLAVLVLAAVAGALIGTLVLAPMRATHASSRTDPGALPLRAAMRVSSPPSDRNAPSPAATTMSTGEPAPIATPAPTRTATPSPTATPSASPSATATPTPTRSATPAPSASPDSTPRNAAMTTSPTPVANGG